MGKDEKPEAIVSYGNGHSGFGWYWGSADYPDEGSEGAYPTRAAAVLKARLRGYSVWEDGGDG